MNTPISEVFLMDCMEYMRGLPDKFFELAVVDPPYGDQCRLSGGKAAKDGYGKYWNKVTEKGNWNISPPIEYFKELLRVSKNQIVWGANHFEHGLKPSSGWVFWDKGQRNFSFSDGELAYTSFNIKLKAITIHRAALHTEERFHPTQKPVALYEWLLKNYAKPGDKILDTHMGSQSSRIAAYKLGFDFYGTEIDPDYFAEGNARFQKEIAMPLFDAPKPNPTQLLAF